MKWRLFESTNDKGQHWTEIWLTLMWANQPLLAHFTTFIRKVLPDFGEAVVPIAIVFSFLMAFRYIGKKLRGVDWALVLGMLVFYIISMLTQYNNPTLAELLPTFAFALCYYIVGMVLDIDRMKEVLYKTSCLCLMVQAFVFFFFMGRFLSVSTEGIVDYMVPAYNVLFHVMMVLWIFFEKPNIIHLAAAFLGVLLVFSFGNRGTLLCTIIFSLLYFLVKAKSLKKAILYVCIIIVVYILSENILGVFSDMVSTLGMSDRIFSRYEEGMITDDNGRSSLIQHGLRALEANEGKGLGLGGDRPLFDGFYVHNLIVEMLISYGYVFGTIVCLIIFSIIVRSFARSNSINKRLFICLLFCPGIVKLMMSGSYLDEIGFYFLLGYCIQVTKNAKLNRLRNPGAI